MVAASSDDEYVPEFSPDEEAFEDINEEYAGSFVNEDYYSSFQNIDSFMQIVRNAENTEQTFENFDFNNTFTKQSSSNNPDLQYLNNNFGIDLGNDFRNEQENNFFFEESAYLSDIQHYENHETLTQEEDFLIAFGDDSKKDDIWGAGFNYEDFSIPESIFHMETPQNDKSNDPSYHENYRFVLQCLTTVCDLLNQIRNESSCKREEISDKNSSQINIAKVKYPYAHILKTGKFFGSGSKLSKEDSLSLGKTNIQIAQGKYSEAVDSCLELIQLVPNAYEPYYTLSFIYKEIGNYERYLEYLLLAANTKKTDSYLWGKLAKLFLENKQPERSKSCYEKASKNTNIIYIPSVWEFICYTFKSGDLSSTSNSLLRLLRYFSIDYHGAIFNVIHKLVPVFEYIEQVGKLLIHMQALFYGLYPHKDDNLLLYYIEKLYRSNPYICFNEILKYYELTNIFNYLKKNLEDSSSSSDECKLDLKCLLKDYSTINYKDILSSLKRLPRNILIWFYVILVSLYENKALFFETILENLISEGVIEDIYNLSTILYKKGCHKLCLICYNSNKSLLTKNAETDYYIMMNIAECYWRTDQIANTLTVYDELLKSGSLSNNQAAYIYYIMAISHYKNKLYHTMYLNLCDYILLFRVQEQRNKYISAFITNEIYSIIDNCKESEFDEHIRLLSVLWTGNMSEKSANFDKISNLLKENLRKTVEFYLKKDGQFLCQFFIYMKSFSNFKCFYYTSEFLIELQALHTSFLISVKNYEDALISLFELGYKKSNSYVCTNVYWNTFSYIIHKIGWSFNVKTFIKFLVSRGALSVDQKFKYIKFIIIAIYNNTERKYNSAIYKFHYLCRLYPDNPIYFLYLGSSMLNVAKNKSYKNIGHLQLQGACFLYHYFQNSGAKTSKYACYNMGRCFHQIGLLHLSEKYYKLALSVTNSSNNLNPIIAHNLAAIYTRSGNLQLAKMILVMYCTI